MPTYTDVAIVLRTHKLGEHDRIVTLLMRGRGKVRAVAKGVRRTKSKFGARLEPAMIVQVQCYEGRNLDTVTQAELIAPYGEQIAQDYSAYTSAAAMLETAERLCEDNEPQLQQFNLIAGGLAALANCSHDPGLVLDSYLLRSVAIAGWAPTFDRCAGCGDPGPHRAFNLASGGAVCSSCRAPGSGAPRPETFILLGALLSADWSIADASQQHVRAEATGLVAAYVQWHLERAVRSLRLVDRTPTITAEGVRP
ncbi:DNA repair protein RecO [Yimella sp. cx-573]|nr:DNA repair protein RecO [Yimella sp. cx-573]